MKATVAEEISVPLATDPATDPAEASSSNDRRQYVARIPIEIPLRIASRNHSASAITIDISVTGLQVHSAIPLTLGDRVLLSLPDEENGLSLTICAEVVRLDFHAGNRSTSLQAGTTDLLREAAHLSTLRQKTIATSYGLRILKDDSMIWQNFVRLQVLSE